MNLFSGLREFSKDPDFRTPPVAHEVPLATVRDGMYLLTDGSLSAVWRVKGLEDELATQRETAGFYQRIQGVLNIVPPGMQIKLLHRIHHNYRDLLDAHEKTLDGSHPFARLVAWEQSQRYRRAMEQGQILRSQNIICLTYDPKVNWWAARGGVGQKMGALIDDFTQTLSGGARQQMMARYQQALQKFDSAARGVVYQMEASDLKPERLGDGELYELAWELLNPRESLRRSCPKIRRVDSADPYSGVFASGAGKKLAAKAPNVTIVAPVSEREQLVASDWKVGDKWMRIDDQFYAVVNMRLLPTETYPGVAKTLAMLGFECTICIDAVMLQKAPELNKQWSQARSAMSQADATLIEGSTPDPANKEKAQQMKDEYLALSAANENPFRLRLSIMIGGPSPDALDERVDVVMNSLREMGQLQAIREHYGVKEAIKSIWPFSPVINSNARKTMTTHVANLMPLLSRWEGSRRPVTLFLDAAMRLVKHDPFPTNQLNRNRIVCGKSGSGKSFAIQLADVHPHAARSKTEILIVESGGSFELTTKCFDGVYLKLGPSCPYTINAFDLPQGFSELTKEKQEEELNFKYSFIKNLVMCMARIVSADDQIVAENVVGTVAQQVYQTVPQPKLRDFYRVLSQYRNPTDLTAEALAGKIMTRLSNYVVTPDGRPGIYSNYFDCDTNFNVTSNIITFDLMDVKNDKGLLDPMAMVVILGLIYNRLMLRDGTERLIIIDEAWALIKEQAGGESPAGQGIELFWREGRKLGGASVMISQNFSDMMTDKVGRAVVGNSPIQYFLVHEPLRANTDAFKNAEFSQSKIDRVYNLTTKYGEFSELMIKEGTEWGVIRLPSAGIRYWISTTDPKDLGIRKKYYDTYMSGYGLDDRTVVALLAFNYPAGFHGPRPAQEMSEQEGLRYAEWWQAKFREFSGFVARGEPIPQTFRMDRG